MNLDKLKDWVEEFKRVRQMFYKIYEEEIFDAVEKCETPYELNSVWKRLKDVTSLAGNLDYVNDFKAETYERLYKKLAKWSEK